MSYFSLFQSPHPARGATTILGVGFLKVLISIHAPREGCDDLRSGFFGLNTISIHAPREGCDPVFANIGEQPILFQSTHPARGATEEDEEDDDDEEISIHAPREGCDGQVQ